MSTEHRLHPLSVVFGLVSDLRSFGWPGLAALVAGGVAGLDVLWIAAVGAAYLVLPMARYLSLRYRFDDQELVIRSGLVFRNERHVPYDRIHHVNAVQNALHRLFGVAEVRLETGSAGETEATLSVVPRSAVRDMREQIQARSRRAVAAPPEDTPIAAQASVDDRALLALGTRDLLLYGLIENRGVVLVAAAAAVLWELGITERWLGRVFGDEDALRESVGEGIRSLSTGGWAAGLGAAVALFLGLLVAIRLLSMAWAAIRLQGFRLERRDDELLRRFGALTRVETSVTRHRIQALTVRDGPLHRLLGRASIDVETAGARDGSTDGSDSGRLAPIVATEAVPGLVDEVLPGVALDRVPWRPVHPRASRRVLREALLVALPIGLVAAALLHWWALPLLAASVAWSVVYARGYVAHLAWAITDEAVYFRSGWWRRSLSVAPLDRVQVVSLHESPFDRRAGMARLKADVAGVSSGAHRIDIPYLPSEVAFGLRDRLAHGAATTRYRW